MARGNPDRMMRLMRSMTHVFFLKRTPKGCLCGRHMARVGNAPRGLPSRAHMPAVGECRPAGLHCASLLNLINRHSRHNRRVESLPRRLGEH